MTKFYGKIGFTIMEEVLPGSWRNKFVERDYVGDVVRNTRRLENGQNINDDITINNSFSIVADPYAYNNIYSMRYLIWMGTPWRITNVEVKSPRLILEVGGVYNKQEEFVDSDDGETPETPDDIGGDSGVE